MKVRNGAIEGFKIPDPRFSRVGRGYSYKTYNEVCNRTAGTCATIDRAAGASSPGAASADFVGRPPPYTQDKPVHVIRGAVWDVAVDIRRGSSPLSQYVAAKLFADNGLRLDALVPDPCW